MVLADRPSFIDVDAISSDMERNGKKASKEKEADKVDKDNKNSKLGKSQSYLSKAATYQNN